MAFIKGYVQEKLESYLWRFLQFRVFVVQHKSIGTITCLAKEQEGKKAIKVLIATHFEIFI